jgi:hypothetical protein
MRRFELGGPERDQTVDLVVANDALYQLSYRPQSRLVWGKPRLQANTYFRMNQRDRYITRSKITSKNARHVNEPQRTP